MLKIIANFAIGTLSIVKGFIVTGRNAFRPSVTQEYPFKKAPMTARYRGLVDLRTEKCIACSQCVKICPTAALDLKSSLNPETKKRQLSAFTFNEELCCSCGLCAEVCPTAAIFMNQQYEICYVRHEDFLAIDLMNPAKYDRFLSLEEKKKP